MHSESRPTNDAAGRSWESRVFQYGLGLITLGLIGLLLPTFGWQLHRLRMLGSAQWVVLVIAVTVGSGAVAWSERRRPVQSLASRTGLPSANRNASGRTYGGTFASA